MVDSPLVRPRLPSDPPTLRDLLAAFVSTIFLFGVVLAVPAGCVAFALVRAEVPLGAGTVGWMAAGVAAVAAIFAGKAVRDEWRGRRPPERPMP